jgi:hypothetical protein
MADMTLDSPPRQQLKAEVEIEEEMEDQYEKARPVDSLLENEPLPVSRATSSICTPLDLNSSCARFFLVTFPITTLTSQKSCPASSQRSTGMWQRSS